MSGNNNHLTNYNSGVVSMTSDIDAPFADGYAFWDPPAEGVHALFAPNFDPGSGSVSTEWWWKPEGNRRADTTDNQWQNSAHWAISYIVSDGNPESDELSMSSGVGQGSGFFGCDGGHNGRVDGPESEQACEADGKWHHIAWVFDKTSEKALLYVDGDLRQQSDYAHNMQRPGTIAFGAELDRLDGGWDHRQTLKGAMTEIRFWNTARSQQEIRAFMRAGGWTRSTGSIAASQCTSANGFFGNPGGPFTLCTVCNPLLS